MKPGQRDQMRELMGVADLSSTADLKAARKAAKASYAAELQAQMRANEEAKLRDRMERLGIAPPPPLQAPPYGAPPQAGGGVLSPGAMRAGMVGFENPSPRPQLQQGSPPQFAPSAVFPHPDPGPSNFGSPGRQAPPPGWGQPPPFQPSYSPSQPSYQPSVGGGFGMASPSSQPPPSMFNGYGPQPPLYGGPGPGRGGYGAPPVGGHGMPPAGGYSPPPPPPLLPGPSVPGGSNSMRRAEQQARKDQYRMELEAQIREREERKAAEKALRLQEDRRKEMEMAAVAARDAMGGRGGGGAPHRDAAGNIVANFAHIQRMGMGPQGPASPGMMGGGPMEGPMMQPSGLVGSPSGMGHPPGMGLPPGMGPPPGMGMGPPPFMGPPPMMGPPPGMGMGPPPPMMDGPNLRFRSNNPYITHQELDNKQRQARELQEALERQIEEKKRAKDLEKARELAEVKREEERFRAGLEQQGARGGDGGAPRDQKEVVADAWEKARLEAEELKRNKFAQKRGGPGGGSAGDAGPSAAGISWGDSDGQPAPSPPPPQPPPPPPLQPLGSQQSYEYPLPAALVAAMDAPPVPPLPRLDPAAAGRPSTPMVVEKVRQVAAAELAAVKQELAAEAAQLREVVAAQGQQVAALKSHTERLEAEAGRAREQAAALRVGIIQQGSVAPEYDRQLGAAGAVPLPLPPPALEDIGLELPPTGAMLRRAVGPPPVYDMGPALPPMNNVALMLDNAGASALNAAPAGERPMVRATMGLRTINPLEASMAGESVFIYPNGREVARDGNTSAARNGLQVALPNTSTASSQLPFQSLHLHGGAIPMVTTTQELEPGPVPQTPAGGALASPHRGDPMAASSSNAAPIDVVPGKQSSLNTRRSGETAVPIDVDVVMSRNQEKLAMLKSVTDMVSGAPSIEALDEFLARYAAQRPGLPERTATPVLRIGTPSHATEPAQGSTQSEGSQWTEVPVPEFSRTSAGATTVYSHRANSAGPLPMGQGRVFSAGDGPKPPGSGAGGSSKALGAVSSPPGAGTLKLTRRNSFTGERTPQEGVLSQCHVPELQSLRPRTGPEARRSNSANSGARAPGPMSGRPPMLPNNRYSNSGRVGSPGAPISTRSSSGRPPSGLNPAAGEVPSTAVLPPRESRSRETRSAPRVSNDCSIQDATSFPSYQPSRESSGAGGLRSHLAVGEDETDNNPARPSPPPPHEDTLDVEMRKGLGSAPAPGSQLGSPGRPRSRPAAFTDATKPPLYIPRAPLLTGMGRISRIGSETGQPVTSVI